MKEFIVEIRETLVKKISVLAESKEDAEDKVRVMYRDEVEETILDGTDLHDTSFTRVKG